MLLPGKTKIGLVIFGISTFRGSTILNSNGFTSRVFHPHSFGFIMVSLAGCGQEPLISRAATYTAIICSSGYIYLLKTKLTTRRRLNPG